MQKKELKSTVMQHDEFKMSYFSLLSSAQECSWELLWLQLKITATDTAYSLTIL